MTLKKSLFAALVAVAAIALSADTSYGWFGRHGGSCGSWGGGSWGSGGSWGGGSWGGGSCGSYGGYSYYGGSCGSWGGGYSAYYGGWGYGGYFVESSRPVRTTIVESSRPVRTTVLASAPATSSVKTRLTLHVPAEAKVTLAGVETKQAGEVRQFATTKLASGQSWDDYKVVVEMNRDGKTLREERTITLTGGQEQDLAITFAEDSTQQVAQR
jgi:uncharacterized protein (TIGR03000 family)